MEINLIYMLCFNILVFLSFVKFGEAVRCYQCSSAEDLKGEDKCGAYNKFDKRNHIAIECNSEESHVPGSFCMKVTQQSPRGFIWNGRWRQVIRRCASVSDTGVTGVCNWGVYENGIYWQECYCSDDECNSAKNPSVSNVLVGFSLSLFVFWRTFW
ncbi:uncharacterized protein LOC109540243 [Dendroctonus ponderosae]|uniref:Protein sleepless n=2 Tax=Dendroctonus ponderosae TaxID=77166 RepID=A0AAR5PT32_DENPD|nr:uncharacterized protein LOC109540243 [Dendroctonus ponderosae]KAH1015977.1 hypothetical protein HUJ04_007275 [Dendroctonus ponderosae]KAH1025269.1 hypothetical protein HUJ05_010026 [Dendroctonus ponderosae]